MHSESNTARGRQWGIAATLLAFIVLFGGLGGYGLRLIINAEPDFPNQETIIVAEALLLGERLALAIQEYEAKHGNPPLTLEEIHSGRADPILLAKAAEVFHYRLHEGADPAEHGWSLTASVKINGFGWMLTYHPEGAIRAPRHGRTVFGHHWVLESP